MEKATLCSTFAVCFGSVKQRGYTNVTFVLVLAASSTCVFNMQVQTFGRAEEHLSSLSLAFYMKHLRQTVMQSQDIS